MDKVQNTVVSSTIGGIGSVASGGSFSNGAITGAFGYLFNALPHTAGDGPNGRDPYDRHQEGVRNQADLLRNQGYEVLGFEVPATVDDLDYGRRYDIVVRDDQGRIFGVEVKTSMTGVFHLDPKQVEFDALAVERGAVTATTPMIHGVMYRGECFGCKADGIYRSWKLTDRLIEKGVPFYPAKPPKP